MATGQKLIIDCSFDRHMSKIEYCAAAKHIIRAFQANRNHRHPFHLTLCNADLESNTIRRLLGSIPTLMDSCFPMSVHREDLTEIVPRERLVYLTQQSRNDLTEFDSNHVYVMPAFIASSGQPPFCIARAKEKGVRMARLPFARHLNWRAGHGTKTPLNQMTQILLDVRSGATWVEAFQHLPPRLKLNPTEERKRKLVERTDQDSPFKLPEITELADQRDSPSRNPFRLRRK